MALGATRRDVIRLIVRSGLSWAMAGIAVGLAVSFALARVLSGLLFGIAPDDPATFVVIAAVMIGVTFGASYLPARRASSVDPVAALRAE